MMNGHWTTRPACALLLAAAIACGGCQSITDWLMGEEPSIREWNTARDLFDQERYEEAAVALRAWLADYHDSHDVLRPTVMYKLAECYRVTRDYERAVRTYSTLIEMYSDSPEPQVRELVGLARLQLDDIVPKTKPAREAVNLNEDKSSP